MNSCINHSHPDYKILNKEVSNKLVLDAIIDDFQKQNNTDTFPNLTYVKTKYTSTDPSYYVKNKGIVALRNVTTGKAVWKEGQYNIYKSGNDIVSKKSKAITETIIYNINRTKAKDLRDKHNLTTPVKTILERYETNKANKEEIAFVKALLANQELSYNTREQFSNKLEEAIQRAVKQWKTKVKDFVAVGKFEKAKIVRERIKIITDNLVFTPDPTHDAAGNPLPLTVRGIPINNISELPLEVLGEGLINFFKIFGSTTDQVLKDFVEPYMNGSKDVNKQLLVDISEYVAYYKPFIEELRGIIERADIPLDHNIQELRDYITDLLSKFSTINSIKGELRVEEIANILDDLYASELDLDKTEPNFRELVKEKLQDDPYANITTTFSDTSSIGVWFGPVKQSSDKIIRAIGIKMTRINDRVRKIALEYGKDLVNKFQDIAFQNVNWMAEKNKGQYTGYFITPFKKEAFEKARVEFFVKLWDKYGLSHNYADRALQITNDLTSAAVAAYKKEERDWYNANTQDISKINTIKSEMRTYFGAPLTSLWLQKHKIKTNSIIGTVVPSNKWLNKDWNKLTHAQKTQLAEIVKEKKTIDLEIQKSIKRRIDPWKMVQISENWKTIVAQTNADLFRRLGKNIKESFGVEKVDDEQFGEAPTLRPDGSFHRKIPIRWITPLEDPDTISTDVVGSLVVYKEMITSFKERSKELADFALLEEQLAERKFINQKKQIKKGIDTNSFSKLRTFLDMNLSDMRRDKLEVDVLGRKVNVTKVLDNFANYVRNNNLINSFFTMASNYISSKSFSWIEALVGEHTTVRSQAFAVKEYLNQVPGLMQEWAARSATSNNKLRLLMEYSNLAGRVGELFGNLNLNKLTRTAVQSGLYFGFELGDLFIKSKVVLSILDNTRQYKEKLLTSQEFEKLNTNVDFYSLPSAYDLIHVRNSKLEFDFSEQEFIKLMGKARALSNAIDGQMSQEDYSAVHKHAVFSLTAIHRNWLFSGIYRRFKTKGYDFDMGVVDEGYFRTSLSLIRDTFFSADRVNSIKELSMVWDELQPFQKRALLRVMAEMATVFIFTMLAVMLNKFEDEDEEDKWALNAAAYLSNRALLEVSAFVNPGEYINVIQDPFVPARNIEYMMDVMELFNGDEISKGPWEGITHRQRFVARLLPGIKGTVMTLDPHYSNEFLKQKPLKILY